MSALVLNLIKEEVYLSCSSAIEEELNDSVLSYNNVWVKASASIPVKPSFSNFTLMLEILAVGGASIRSWKVWALTPSTPWLAASAE